MECWQSVAREFFPGDPSAPARLKERCLALGIALLEPPPHPLLSEISRPPRALFALGDWGRLSGPGVAVVGTRVPSSYGRRMAAGIGADLAAVGLGIVSGLARGIDAFAHAGALSAGGYTAAVLGHGLDRIYPAENRGLAASILRGGGCLLSEYPPGIPPRPAHFPCRNRIIAGLSLGVVVVEAAERSGSLITARLALDSGREVFAFPGPCDGASFQGSHRLIQQGAKLVTRVEEVIEELGHFPLPRAARVCAGPLARAFERCGGEATLGELAAVCEGSLGNLAGEIELARQGGWIGEVGTQRFVWLRPRHPPPCQTGNFS